MAPKQPPHLYVVAVKLQHRAASPADWSSALTAIPGVELVSMDSPHSITIRSTPTALRELKSRFGEVCRIEPLARYSPR